MTIRSRHTRMVVLPCELSDEELSIKQAELARATMQERAQRAVLDRMLAEHKEEKKDIEKIIGEMHSRCERLAEEVTSGVVDKDVRCEWQFNIDGGFKYLIRMDLGRCVLREKLSDQERQLQIGERLEQANEEQISLWEQQFEELGAVVEAEPEQEEEPEDLEAADSITRDQLDRMLEQVTNDPRAAPEEPEEVDPLGGALDDTPDFEPTRTPANEEGRLAYMNGEPEASNPYKLGTSERRDWLGGWNDAEFEDDESEEEPEDSDDSPTLLDR